MHPWFRPSSTDCLVSSPFNFIWTIPSIQIFGLTATALSFLFCIHLTLCTHLIHFAEQFLKGPMKCEHSFKQLVSSSGLHSCSNFFLLSTTSTISAKHCDLGVSTVGNWHDWTEWEPPACKYFLISGTFVINEHSIPWNFSFVKTCVTSVYDASLNLRTFNSQWNTRISMQITGPKIFNSTFCSTTRWIQISEDNYFVKICTLSHFLIFWSFLVYLHFYSLLILKLVGDIRLGYC